MNTAILPKGNAKPRRKTEQYVDKNPIEQLFDIGSGVISSTADLGKKMVSLDNMDEILGYKDSKKKQKEHPGGDLSEGQILDLRKIHEQDQAEARAEVEPGLEYVREIVHAGERQISRENQEVESQLRELMAEIKKLADSSKELQAQFKEIAIEQHIVKPGKYHKSFFSWMLSMIRIARQKVEDSGAWLAAMQSKKKSREYGAMAKKHGTTFSLSNERVVSTQVG